LTIDSHDVIDNDGQLEFFCSDLSPYQLTLEELERRAQLRRQEETAAILARWEAAVGRRGKRASPRAGR
jgi:hypothetical protein